MTTDDREDDDLREPTKADVIARLAGRPWITLPMMAKLCGLHYQTIIQHAKSGKLGAIRVGGRYRVYEDEIIRFLTEGNYIGAHTFSTITELEAQERKR